MKNLQDDNAENRLKSTFFVVEATSFEQFCCWQNYANTSSHPLNKEKTLNWNQYKGGSGWLITVGKLNKMPCCISVTWCVIEGQLIMFWYNCSQVTDSRKSEKWLNKHFKGKYDSDTRRAECDANNFTHCISAIREANKKKLLIEVNSS